MTNSMPNVPDGWVVVPCEPTEEMLAATVDERGTPRILDFTTPDERAMPFVMARYSYRAMLSAASKLFAPVEFAREDAISAAVRALPLRWRRGEAQKSFEREDVAPIVDAVLSFGAEVAGAIADVAAERRRQVEAEGWSPEHDDGHDNGDLAIAAACYAAPDRVIWPSPRPGRQGIPADLAHALMWPWADECWKPGTDRRRQLVKAAALLVAEIERLDRASEPPRRSEG